MPTIDYDFQPGDQVFVVIDDTRVEEATVLTVEFKVYEDDTPIIVTVVTYSILLADAGEGTVVLDSSDVYATLQEASAAVGGFLTPTPTPTVTPTLTPTTSITPSISATPAGTPVVTGTPTVTPTTTGTPTVTPTVTVSPTLTPTPTITPSNTPVIQSLYIVESRDPVNSLVSQHTMGTINVMSSATPNNTSFNVTAQVTDPSGIFIDNSRTKMFILDRDTRTLFRYTLVLPGQVNTAVYTGDFHSFAPSTHNVIKEILFNPTGTRLYTIRDQGDDEVHQHDLGSPWDLSTVSTSYDTLSINPERVADGIFFGDSGTKLYVCGNNSLKVYRFDLTSAYDILTATFNQFLDISVASERIEGASLSSAGDILFVYVDGIFRTYDLASPWTLPNAVIRGAIGTYAPTGIGQGRSYNLQQF